jgi:hypothetical protein
MSFKIAVSPTYTVPVKVDIPADDGKTQRRVFTARFKRLEQEELEELTERMNKGELTDKQIIDEVLVGWGDDVMSEDGEKLEFNASNLNSLLRVFPTKPTIVRTFFDSIKQATRKN